VNSMAVNKIRKL